MPICGARGFKMRMTFKRYTPDIERLLGRPRLIEIVFREQWLTRLGRKMQPTIAGAAGVEMAQWRVTCAPTSRTVGGRAHDACLSADGTHEIIVSMAEEDEREVAVILAHELVHVAVEIKHGHKGPFQRVAKAIGFMKPWRSTPATLDFWMWVDPLLEELPRYPHAKLDRPSPIQSTRMLKVECTACGFITRTTAKWLRSTGPPYCACNHDQMQICWPRDGELNA